VTKLRALYQSPPVEDRVRIFFDKAWERILRMPDPAAAAAEFFNGKRRRGRKPDSEERNFQIARAVQKLIDSGMTVEEACKKAKQALESARRIGSWERIREIYYGPAADEEAKFDWRSAIGAPPTATGALLILAALEPCLRAVLAATDRTPKCG
jgi:hypothetical protein